MKTETSYKQTEIGEIPEEWESVPIVEVCKGTTESFLDGDWILSKDLDNNGDVRLIQLGNIGEGQFIDSSKKWISFEKFRELDCTLVRTGDILVSRMADPIARSCIVPSLPYKCITAVDVTIVRPNEREFDRNFVDYLFNSKIVLSQAQSLSAGATRPRISRRNLEQVIIPKPTLQEQQKIASILSTVDDAIQKTDEIIQKTQQLKKGLMQQLLTKGMGHTKFKKTEIGEIPEEWEVVTIDEIKQDSLKNGIFVKNPKWESGFRFLNVVDTYGDAVVQPHQLERIEVADEVAHPFMLKEGDIVFVRSSLKLEGIAQACMIRVTDEPLIFDCHLIKLTPNRKRVNPRYLVEYCRSSIGKKQLISLSKTTTMTTIHQKNLAEFKFPLPPLLEQDRIASILSALDDKVSEEMRKRKHLETLKKGLMQVLLTGKVRVKVN